jgi:hypothetical protein
MFDSFHLDLETWENLQEKCSTNDIFKYISAPRPPRANRTVNNEHFTNELNVKGYVGIFPIFGAILKICASAAILKLFEKFSSIFL